MYYKSKTTEIKRYENDGTKQGILKLDLAKHVVEEYRLDPDAIIDRFRNSMEEVIQILKEIEASLLK